MLYYVRVQCECVKRKVVRVIDKPQAAQMAYSHMRYLFLYIAVLAAEGSECRREGQRRRRSVVSRPDIVRDDRVVHHRARAPN